MDARLHSVDDMVIRLQLLPEHSHGIGDLVLPIDVVMLDDRMDVAVLFGQRDIAGDFLDFLQVLRSDLHLLVGHADRPTVVQTLDVGSRHREKDGVHLHVAAFLGAHERVVQAGLDGLGIDNLPFPDSGGRMLSDAEYLDGPVTSDFSDDHAHFRCSDLQPDVDVRCSHRLESPQKK